MKIKEFVEQYNGYATDYLKEDFLKENLKITPYIPFVTKEALARQIVKISTYDKKTGNIKLNSVVHHHLYCRMIIEYYTNLERKIQTLLMSTICLFLLEYSEKSWL